MIGPTNEQHERLSIKVIGVGGAGGNAIEHMMRVGIEGVEFVCVNTDAQAIQRSSAHHTIQLGIDITKGLGAGADPDVARRAALADQLAIEQMVRGCDMVFIAAGMGGGTGTGAAPIIAEIAKNEGVLTVCVVGKPFAFEGRKRMKNAEMGLQELRKHADSLIVTPNEKMIQVLGRDVSLVQAFEQSNSVLMGAVQGIAELITKPGFINVDFADVRTVMAEMGQAVIGTASTHGENRAKIAAENAISSPFLEDISLDDARGILVNITAGPDLTIGEFQDVGDVIHTFANDQATVIVGTVIDAHMRDEIRVTVVVTGLRSEEDVAEASSSEHHVASSVSHQTTPEQHALLKKRQVIDEEPYADSIYDMPSFLRRKKKKK